MEKDYKPLKEIVDLVIDYRGKTPLKLGGEWCTSGYRALSALNVKTRGLVAEDKIRFVDEELYRKWMKEEIKKGDILITSEAPFGQVLQWNSDEKIVLSQRLFALRIKRDYCSSYIYQYMASDFFYGELKARATGSTVEGLRQPALMRCKIAIPEIFEQRRIASILSAYDNLIENNNRRIRLLEQMAENLYKEWFVRFRFPGHEKAEFENGLPKGWKYVTIKDICSVTDGVHNTIQDTPQSKYYLLSCKNIKDGKLVIGDNERTIDEETFLKLRKRTQLAKGDILISSVGTIGETILLNEDPAYFEFQRSVAMIKPDKRYVNSNFIYEMLKSMRKELVNAAHGVAQQCLFIGDINKMRILLPAMNTIVTFEEKVQPIYDKILSLSKQSAILSRQRDLLLPRLMSGKLEVKV